jgi:membrane dipeptidase
MRTLLSWTALLLALVPLVTTSCTRDRASRRELTTPLGPSDADVPPSVPVLALEPDPAPQFSVRVGGEGANGGTGMGRWLWALGQAFPTPPPPEPPTDLEVHMRALVVDTHVDTTQDMADDGFDLLERHRTGHLDLPRMREGGLDAAFFSIWVNPRRHPNDAFERSLRLFEAVHEVAWRSPDAVVADTVAAIRQAAAEGRTALLLGVEGAHALGTADLDEALSRLRLFRSLGARYLTLTWSNDNPFGHASTGNHPERGLTEAGRALIAEMERIGIVVDVSHVSDQTFWDIMVTATRPVLASHSSARALADHPRNMTDEMIRAVAEGGGAVCVNYFTLYIDRDYAAQLDRVEREHPERFRELETQGLSYPARFAAFRRLVRELAPDLAVPDVATVVDHLMHIVELAGPETACLGSDFDGVPEMPRGLEDVTGLPAITAELRRRGLSDDEVRLVLGDNVLRVLAASEPGAPPFSFRPLPSTAPAGTGAGTGLEP